MYSLTIRKPRRRIKTEENAKVGAAVLGTEFFLFLAELAILHYRRILNSASAAWYIHYIA